jgi:hypothetical protein
MGEVVNPSRRRVDERAERVRFAAAKGLLRELSSFLEDVYEVPLPVDDLLAEAPLSRGSVKKVKEFSVGLLENPVDHDWSKGLKKISVPARVSIGGSLFLWRKTLPVLDVPEIDDHISRVTAPEVALPTGYIAHCVRTVEEMFPVGWDHGYMGAIDRSVPTVKSVIGSRRGEGGWRARGPCRESFGMACVGERELEDHRRVQYSVAPCDGKLRAVTIMTPEAQCLKPLHKLIYDQISKYPWLLRGEAKPAVFKGFHAVKGEVFVSGDYESATDHLPVSTAEWILRAIFRRCRHVPLSIQRAALSFLRAEIEYEHDGEVFSMEATRQLMGSLLCFPLLCLQNYCAFRWVFPGHIPVKINGDDIVFRSTREDYEKWAHFVGSVGLVLSRGKTLVNPRFFSLNSTFFWSSPCRISIIPVVRTSTLMSDRDTFPNALAGSYGRFVKGWKREAKVLLAGWFLRRKQMVIRKSGRSVLRGLGIPVPVEALRASGLLKRELWYFNSTGHKDRLGADAKEIELPPPPTKLVGQVPIPRGWKRVPVPRNKGERRKLRAASDQLFEQLVDRAWDTPLSCVDVARETWAKIEATGFESAFVRYSTGTGRIPRFALSAGFLHRNCDCASRGLPCHRPDKYRLYWKPLNLYLRASREKKEKVWVFEAPDDPVDVGREPSGPITAVGSFAPTPELLVGCAYGEMDFPSSELRRRRTEEEALSSFIQ